MLSPRPHQTQPVNARSNEEQQQDRYRLDALSPLFFFCTLLVNYTSRARPRKATECLSLISSFPDQKPLPTHTYIHTYTSVHYLHSATYHTRCRPLRESHADARAVRECASLLQPTTKPVRSEAKKTCIKTRRRRRRKKSITETA